MIYNNEFVWLHFPKCAGTKIEKLFSRYFSREAGLVQDPVGLENDPSIAWHDSISDRQKRDSEFELGDRKVVCSFRRLPGWLESRYQFEVKRNPGLAHQPESLLQGKFLEANGLESNADNYVKKFLPEELLHATDISFLRVEHFEVDFKSIFGAFLDVSKIPDREYKKKVNTSRRFFTRPKRYLPDYVREQLYDYQQKLVYEHCPYWRMVEERAYPQARSV